MLNCTKFILPIGNLDHAASREIMQIFQKIHESGKTIIMVTHNREIAEKCQRNIEILDGKLITAQIN